MNFTKSPISHSFLAQETCFWTHFEGNEYANSYQYPYLLVPLPATHAGMPNPCIFLSLRKPDVPVVPNLTIKQTSFDIKLNISLHNLLFNLMKDEVGMTPRMIKSILNHCFWIMLGDRLCWYPHPCLPLR